MVVALTFIDGEVHIRSRFVQTKHRIHEQKQQRYNLYINCFVCIIVDKSSGSSTEVKWGAILIVL